MSERGRIEKGCGCNLGAFCGHYSLGNAVEKKPVSGEGTFSVTHAYQRLLAATDPENAEAVKAMADAIMNADDHSCEMGETIRYEDMARAALAALRREA